MFGDKFNRAKLTNKIGMGDIKGMMDMMGKLVPQQDQAQITKRLKEGKFSLRDMYDQFQNLLKMGPLNKGSVHYFSLSPRS